jgi:pimeloyl-ACP methyl ester carboxylesterase
MVRKDLRASVKKFFPVTGTCWAAALAVCLLFLPLGVSAQKYGGANAALCDSFRLGKTESRVVCGRLDVPEDHNDSKGRKISIAFIIYKAKAQKPKPDPVIFFSGGPGGASVVPGLSSFLGNSVLAETRDVIFFDQRGIHFSSPLPDIGKAVFDAMAADTDMAGERKMIAKVLKEFREKADAEGIDLGGYNSIQNALDVGVLMDKLGYKKYNLYGISYGTRLARLLEDLYPGKINTVTLDSPNLMTDDFLIDRMSSYSSSAEKVFAACEADAECTKQHPGIRDEYVKVINSLKSRPIEVPLNGIVFHINPQDAMYLLRRQLYRPDALTRFPDFLAALKDANIKVLKETLDVELEDVVDAEFNTSMFLAVSAFESMDPANTPAVIDKLYRKMPHFPVQLAFFTNLYIEGMNWTGKSLPMEQRKFKTSGVPTFIFVNQYDPVTPPENGVLFQKQLTDSHLFIIDQGGHGGGNFPCKLKMMRAFMDDPAAASDSSCLPLFKP